MQTNSSKKIESNANASNLPGMDKHVFIASVATETNTFSPLRTDLQDFKDSFYAEPGQHPATPTLCSAVYTVARAVAFQHKWRLTEGTACWAEPGGVLNQHSWEFLKKKLLSELQAALPVDIVLLGLHGAMVAQECKDCEGELLEEVRQLVGDSVLVGVTFDPHSHLSQKRVENANLITVFKEFPHTDFVETAENLVYLMHRTSLGEISPVLSVFDCRMIEVLPTSREPMRGFVDEIKQMEGQGGILSISVIHGFMAGDVPDMGSKIIVISDDSKLAGDKLAKQLGMQLYSFRGKTKPDFLSPQSALDKAQILIREIGADDHKPVVVADVWDNPGGGVAGDSTIILREIFKRKLQNVALATIWDPIAVRTCLSAGTGATLQLRFGGKMSASGGEPIDAEVKICNVVHNATQSFCESTVPIGDSVWIHVQGVDIILNSVRSQVFEPDIFSNMGIDPKEKSMLIVKSTNHFYAAFSKIALTVLYAAVNGPYPNNPVSTSYQQLERQIWPRVKNPHDIV